MTYLNEDVRRSVALRICALVCDPDCAEHAWAREQGITAQVAEGKEVPSRGV